MNKLVSLYHRFGGFNLIKEYFRTGYLFKAPFQILTPIHKPAYKCSKENMEKVGTYFDEIINKGNI